MKKRFSRLLATVGTALLLAVTPAASQLGSPDCVYAEVNWPSDCTIRADAGIVMDAATGTVLYGKNIHSVYAPASITKVLTALIVLEKCSPDDTVTFSYEAVHNVEDNSSSAGYDTGDKATVETLLYALLLKSANESANALAEYAGGSIPAFVELMNEKAKELGCEDSHFANPSGLNDPNHYVSAYDMALITRAALENSEFRKIVATPYYELPPNSKYPDGQGISPGNKMVKSNWKEQYRPDCIGGKTGYTSLALNTLVNGAERDGFRVVTVVLHSDDTQYQDTSAMMDFAFRNFRQVRISDYGGKLAELGKDLSIAGLSVERAALPSLDRESRMVLPKGVLPEEVTTEISYDLPDDAPADASAVVNCMLDGQTVGKGYLKLEVQEERTADQTVDRQVASILKSESRSGTDAAEVNVLGSGSAEKETGAAAAVSAGAKEVSQAAESLNDGILQDIRDAWAGMPMRFRVIMSVVTLLIAGILGYHAYSQRRKMRERAAAEGRRQRREERLKEDGLSPSDIQLMTAKRLKKTEMRMPEKRILWSDDPDLPDKE
ncbi:D-alanyl-D-alanine carboxypeptidase family protein [[Clostridium] aminophilum]|uniref:D-alanyl-D-alanine carboxypeptidase family protein n=1 Tax=[Clostridium] aminophilum TaxID=1526 RepID=UPI0026ED748B|nr:D-alanyl-D-alanine carboxypeptidase family protein [[Clostridium] aminophilum]MDD6195851.1 D-alanyl-D-alanine carboxypeptidase [[Clostridium] aminophilum]